MPRVQLQKYGTYVDFPDSMSPADMQAAIERDVIPHMEKKQSNPGGDNYVPPVTLREQAAQRLARMGGQPGVPVDPNDPRFIPTDTHQQAPGILPTIGHALKGAAGAVAGVAGALTADTSPTGLATAAGQNAASMYATYPNQKEATAHAAINTIPLVGDTAEKLATPAIAYSAGNRPVSAPDNLRAAEGAGEAAALVAGPKALEKSVGAMADAGEALGTKQINRATDIQTKVIDPQNTNPTLARRVAQEQLQSGTGRMSNPPQELAARGRQMVEQNPDDFATTQRGIQVEHDLAPNAQAPVGAGADTVGIGKGLKQVGGAVGRFAGEEAALSAVGSVAGPVAAVVAPVARAIWSGPRLYRTIQEVMTSPGWKTASAQLKYNFGKAIGGQDFTTATQLASEIDPVLVGEYVNAHTPRAVPDDYDPRVTDRGDNHILTDAEAAENAQRLNVRPAELPPEADPMMISRNPKVEALEQWLRKIKPEEPVQPNDGSTPLRQLDEVTAIQQQAADTRYGDVNAATGDANPTPPRKPVSRTKQPPVLESAGRQISKGQVPTHMPGKEGELYAPQQFVNEQAGQAADTNARNQNIEFGKQFGPQLRTAQMKAGNYGKWSLEARTAYEQAQRNNDFASMIRIENEANSQLNTHHNVPGVQEQSLLSDRDAVAIQTGQSPAYYIDPDGNVTPLDDIHDFNP